MLSREPGGALFGIEIVDRHLLDQTRRDLQDRDRRRARLLRAVAASHQLQRVDHLSQIRAGAAEHERMGRVPTRLCRTIAEQRCAREPDVGERAVLVSRRQMRAVGNRQAAFECRARLSGLAALDQRRAFGVRESQLRARGRRVVPGRGETALRADFVVLQTGRVSQTQQRVEYGELPRLAQCLRGRQVDAVRRWRRFRRELRRRIALGRGFTFRAGDQRRTFERRRAREIRVAFADAAHLHEQRAQPRETHTSAIAVRDVRVLLDRDPMRDFRLADQSGDALQPAVVAPDVGAEFRLQTGRQRVQRLVISLQRHRVVARFLRDRRDVLASARVALPVVQCLACVRRSGEQVRGLARMTGAEFHEAAQRVEARQLACPEFRCARERF